MKSRIAVALAALTLVLCDDVAAQSTARFQITPRAGVHHPMNEIGGAALVEGPWYLRLDRADPSASFAIDAHVKWPSSVVSVRVVGFAALPATAAGRFDCLSICPSILLRTEAEVSARGAFADVIVAPFSSAALRPFAALGVGVKRYRYEWPAAAVFVTAASSTETTGALHAAIGFELDFVGAPLRFEVGDYYSAERELFAFYDSSSGTSTEVRRNPQHDIAVTLGWSLIRF
jgi:hypothetical protein